MIKRIKIEIVIRVIFLCLTIWATSITFFKYNLNITPALLLGAFVIQTYLLIYSLDRINRGLIRFFDSIKFSDDSLNINFSGQSKTYKNLANLLKEIRSAILRERLEKETNLKFLEFIINNINHCLLVFNRPNNKILFSNIKANHIFNQYSNDLDSIRSNKGIISQILESNQNIEFNSKIHINSKPILHNISAINLIISGENITLVIIEDIEERTNKTEQNAYEQLIRVLTHEIMNSLTPITSLSQTAHNIISLDELAEEDKQDVMEALETIQKRGLELQDFIKSYRNMTLLPNPNFAEFDINEIIKEINNLFKNDFNQYNIDFKYNIDGDARIIADKSLLNQVFVNLIINAIDAVKSTKIRKININIHRDKYQNCKISFEDTGYGIEPENLDEIFVPFFSTKRKGTGVGLNLCKQIVQLHNGSIEVFSEIDKGSKFIITL